ncbi:MAG TPA: hypothetical protein VNK46_00800 [Nitrospiraceae bacterium]|jgi:hypothetical protein|nr:hypothetical protein [Nitrospiraceae bacterium]
MAQKFGNGRWVREGYLDNRVAGCVVGRITFAAVGAVPFYLVGNFKGEIYGKAIRFRNGRFADEELAAQVLADFEVPQVGEVSLISFDPHPLLTPHPYIEWFSLRKNHYRIELAPEDAWVLSDREAVELDADSRSIREHLRDQVRSTSDRDDSEWI